MSSRNFKIRAVPVPVVTAPAWFTALPYNKWVDLGNRIRDVVEGPAPWPGPYTPDDITGAGNGAAMDQVNREMLIVNTGGHSGWWGGDGYRLILKEDAGPRWERLTTWLPSYRGDIAWITSSTSAPNPSIPLALEEFTMQQYVNYGGGVTLDAQGRGSTTWKGPDGSPWDRYNWPCTFVDGVSAGQRVREWKPWNTPDVDSIMERPRAVHTCYSIHYSDGKVWYPTQNGSNNGSGRGSRVPQSFDVDFVRSYIALAGVPYPLEYGNKKPWKYYPAVDNKQTPSTFNASAMDTGNGRMWVQASNGTTFFYVGTKGAEAGGNRTYTLPFAPQSRFVNAPSQICPDAGRRMWVVVPSLAASGTPLTPINPTNEIVVYDLDELEKATPAMATAVTKITVSGLDTLPWSTSRNIEEARKGYGMIWYAPAKEFWLFNCDVSPRDTTNNTSTIFRLIPPLNADGSWDRLGTWTVGTKIVGGIPAICSSGTQGIMGSSFSRFNIINDMGNGEALLISQGNVLNQASFLRLKKPEQVTYTPGHYTAFEVSRNGVDSTFSNANHPGIVGVQLRYYWKDLEPTQGAYNFSAIIADLNNAQAVGKRVIVMLIDKTFNAQVATPDYLASYTSPSPSGAANGTSLQRWKTVPRDRMVALMQALAGAIKTHPALEAVALQESSIGISTANLFNLGYTKEAYRDAFKTVLSAACTAFPTKRVFWYMNFIAATPTSTTAAGSGGQAMIGEVIDHMLAAGYDNFSFGGPDILPRNAPLTSLTYPYYSTYAGRVRMFCSNQFDSYESVASAGPPVVYDTMGYMLDWAETNLRINYCLWNYNPTANPVGSNDYADALAAIAAKPVFGPGSDPVKYLHLDDANATYPTTDPLLPAVTHKWPRITQHEMLTTPVDGVTAVSKYQYMNVRGSSWISGLDNVVAYDITNPAGPANLYTRHISGHEYQGYTQTDAKFISSGFPFSTTGPATVLGNGITESPIFAGHWLYEPFKLTTGAINSTDTVIQLNNTSVDPTNAAGNRSVLRVGEYACIYDAGTNFVNAEHVKIISIDSATQVTVQRGHKSAAVAHASGSRFAQHVLGQGPGTTVGSDGELWTCNFSTQCPTDANGKQWAELYAVWLSQYFDKTKNNLPFATAGAIKGIHLDTDFYFDLGSMDSDCNNDGVRDSGRNLTTGENYAGDGIDYFYRRCSELMPGKILVAGIHDARGYDFYPGIQMEVAWDYGNGDFVPNPKYLELNSMFAMYLYNCGARARSPGIIQCLNKTPTLLYPMTGTPEPGTPTDNKPARLGMALTYMDNGYWGTHSRYEGDAWYDEFAVDVTPGSANYGKAVPKTPLVTVRGYRGWLGNPLGKFRRVFDPTKFTLDKSLIGNSSFVTDTSGWTGTQVTLTKDASTAMNGTTSLAVSTHTTYQSAANGAVVTSNTMSLLANTGYTVCFAAKASKHREIEVQLGNLRVQRIPVGPKWRQYVVTFNTTTAQATATLKFNVGKENTPLWFDSVYVFAGDANVFRRDFENGIVLANATPNAVTIDLLGTFRRILGTQDPVNDGQLVTSVTLPGYDGLLLVR